MTQQHLYAAMDPNLVALAADADVWITDCQYSHDEYRGVIGVPKLGWGHSYPGYIADVARAAKPALVVTTHHDPEARDEHIVDLARQVSEDCDIEAVAAYEGLAIDL